MGRMMKVSEFKAKCLGLVDDVANGGEAVIITKHGKPVARLMPVERPRFENAYGAMKGQIKILGDIIAPASDAEDWEVLQD